MSNQQEQNSTGINPENHVPVITIKLHDLLNSKQASSNTFTFIQEEPVLISNQAATTPYQNYLESLKDLSFQSSSSLDSTAGPSSSLLQPMGYEPSENLHSADLIDFEVKAVSPATDVNATPYSYNAFEKMPLDKDLLINIFNMGYNKPSSIQEVAIPLILSDPPKNLIAQSQNGTGKTAAFVLSILMRIDRSLNATQAICLTPSRELARQIANTIHHMTQDTNITSIAVLKDIFQPTGTLSANDVLPHQIIVGTPGIILDSLKRRKTINSKYLKMLVLDEADNMLDQDGLGDQSLRIKNLIHSNPQILLFSATFPDHVSKYARRFAPDPNEITLRIEELSVQGIKQCYMDCISEEQKYDVVCNIYDLITVSQSIIFCKLRKTADIISSKMRESGHSVLSMHGNMSSAERDERIDDFRRGKYKVLVTTNLISRGIDISQVSLVVNYDMPLDIHGNPDAEVYLHRIGRTGRFGRKGVSVIFVHNEKTLEQMKYLEEHFKVTINRVPTEDWEEAEKVFKQFL